MRACVVALGGAAGTYAYSAMFMVLLEEGWLLRPSPGHHSGQYPSNDEQGSGPGGGEWATKECDDSGGGRGILTGVMTTAETLGQAFATAARNRRVCR